MPKHKLKSISTQAGRLCLKACRSLIAKMAACHFRRWAWVSLFILLLAGGLLGSLFVGERRAEVAINIIVSGSQSGNTFTLNLDYSHFAVSSHHRFVAYGLNYSTISSGQNCPPNLFLNTGPYDVTFPTSNPTPTYRISLPANTTRVCVQAFVRRYDITTYNIGVTIKRLDTDIDLIPPVVTIAKSGSTYTASATDNKAVDHNTWEYKVSTKADCSDQHGSFAGRSRSFTVYATQKAELNGLFICFYVSDTVGNRGQASMRIGTPPFITPTITTPAITLSQSFVNQVGRSDDILITATADQDISEWAWAYVSSSPPAQGDCSSGGLFYNMTGTGLRTAETQLLQPSSSARWICVKGKNASGIYGFASARLQRQIVDIALSQYLLNGKVHVLALSRDGIEINTWGYSLVRRANLCFTPGYDGHLSFDSSTDYAANVEVNPSTASSWTYLCVKVTARNGAVGRETMRIMRATAQPPNITLAQSFVSNTPEDDILITADADQDIVEWHWTYASATDTCSSMTTYSLSMTRVGATQATQALPQSSARNNLWICVRAKNSAGLPGFAKKKLEKQPTVCNSANPPPNCPVLPPLNPCLSANPPPNCPVLPPVDPCTLPNPPTSCNIPTTSTSTLPTIQTCSGISSWSSGGGSVNLGFGSVLVNYIEPSMTTTTISRPNPNHDPNDPNSPATETQTKQVLTSISRSGGIMLNFGTVSISPPAIGPPDSSSNLATATTHMRPNYSGGGSGPPDIPPNSAYFGGTSGGYWFYQTASPANYSSSSSASVTSGIRKSDGASTRSSPPNYYDKGTIEAWSWSGSWGVSVTASSIYSYTSYIVIPDYSWDGGPGTAVPITLSQPFSKSGGGGGGFGGCTRTLVVKSPTCTPKLRTHPDNGSWPVAHLPTTTETFNPYVEHGGGGQTISVFPVGTDSRTGLVLRNRGNFFELASSGSSFSYSRASPYNSGRNPAAGGRGIGVAIMGSELNGASWNSVTSSTIEPGNAINFPGQYRVTWRPSWSSRASGAGWTGSELNGSVCEYEPSPRNAVDPQEGPQSHPSRGTEVGSLSLNVWVYADPPTCSVDEFLFEVNDPPMTRITLSNPNRAPMDVDITDWTISRGGYSQPGNSGTHTISAGTPSAPGTEEIIGNAVAINHSGEFTALWSLQTSMGTETWTTWDKGTPPQRSWFQDPDERIVTSGGLECQSTGNKIVYLPFIKVFYGSLAAGGRFGDKASYDACGENFDHVVGEDSGLSVNNSFVAGHAEGSGPSDARGSSVEYALQANNIIGGFYSASQRSSDPQPLKGLTFSNNDALHDYGGNFGRQACIANYWREVEKLTAEPVRNLNLSWLQNNDRKLYEADPAGSSLEIKNDRAPTSLDLKATIYVDGDVYITDDIINNDASTPKWYNPSQIGYISIIVRGDINIAPNVKQIDALLVAYPKEDSGGDIVSGTIRTCYAGNINAGNHFDECKEQLVINGALIAEKVLFGRVFASVKQETSYPATPPRATNPGGISNYVPNALRSLPAVPNYVLPDCSDILNGNLGISWSLPSSHPDYPNPLGYSYSLRYIHYIPYPGYIPLSSNAWNRSGSVYSNNIDFNGLPGSGYYSIRISTLRGSIGNTTPGDLVAYGLLFCPVPFAAQPIHVSNFQNHPSTDSNVRPYSRINLRCELRTGTIHITVDGRRYDHYRMWISNGITYVLNQPNRQPYRYMVRVSGPAIRWRPDGYAENWYNPTRNSNQHLETRIGWSPGVKGPFRITVSDYSESQLLGLARLGRLRGSITQTMICDNSGIGISVPVPPPGVIPPLVPVLQETTKAAEVINLLPEYFIGVPELPLFPDQIYKTDSVSTQPVNF